jgi:hypothetical protein
MQIPHRGDVKMSKFSEPFNSSRTPTALFAVMLFFPLPALAAQGPCQAFLLQGDELVIDAPSGSLQSGSLAAMVGGLTVSQQLSVNFSSSQACVEQGAAELSPSDSVRFVINEQAQELAIQVTIAGSTQLWLRLSPGYQSELLLDRSVGEDIGLTDMEFLSDNSGVGAEDFFAEQIDYLELGSHLVDAPFAEVPRYGVEYVHYDESVNQGLQGFVVTQGILGLDLLRTLTLRFNPSQGLVFFTK